MKTSYLATLALAVVGIFAHAAPAQETQDERPSVIVAIGAEGAEEYRDTFNEAAKLWEKASAAGGARVKAIGESEVEALARLHTAVEAEPKQSLAPLWIVLLGHGTFDGREGKFNLRGDDLGAAELAKWLQPFSRPVVIVCGFSASGAFLKPLAGPDRVVITATRSGAENNFSRFGSRFAEAIADPAADLDKDGQTSVLEAWISAAQRVAAFYQGEGRLATEHALLDDNGDGFGTPPDWFSGVRLVKKSGDARNPDGLRANQIHLVPSAAERALPPAVRKERDALERELTQLRDAKTTLPENEYYAKLEALLLRLARLYRDGAAGGS